MAQKEKNRIPFSSAMGTKVMFIAMECVVVACIACMVAIIPSVRNHIKDTNKRAMESIVDAYEIGMEGKMADAADAGRDITYEDYAAVLENARIEGVASAYAYLVSSDGTMLYHPTREKVGQPVENAVIKEVVAEIKAGQKPAGEVVTYDFKGVNKYAGYKVLSDNSILVLTADEEEILAEVSGISTRAIVVCLVVIFVLGCVAKLSSTILIRPLRRITNAIEEIGELHFKDHPENNFLVRRKDECGVMARAVRSMRENLRDMVENIEDVNQRLTQTVDMLLESSQDINAVCTDNSATTQELAAGMEETAATTETIHSSIGGMKGESSNIYVMSQDGEKYSNEVQNRAGKLKQSTEESVQRTEKMYTSVKQKTEKAIQDSKAVEQINELTHAIMEISSQTSLLALNASIEAARAGEAGRGFSVVATEIGNLAGQTSKTVENINSIVGAVNLAVGNMAESLNESIAFLENTVLKDYNGFNEVSEQYASDAAKFRESMSQIEESAQKLNDTISSIADGIDGINETVGEATTGVTDIADKTSSVVTKTSENNELVQNCLKDAELLKSIAEKFTIE